VAVTAAAACATPAWAEVAGAVSVTAAATSEIAAAARRRDEEECRGMEDIRVVEMRRKSAHSR